jgi:hypothetical protein
MRNRIANQIQSVLSMSVIYPMAELFIVSLIIGGILLPFVFSGFILHTIDNAAKQRRQPVMIWLIDLFSLMFLVQLPLAILFRFEYEQRQPVVVAAALITGVMLLIWWATTRTVSKAGISRVSDRAWIALLVIPMTYLGSFAIVVIGGCLASSVWGSSNDFNVPVLAGIELALIGLLIFSLHVARRVVRRSAAAPPEIIEADVVE